jgi:hypothetical protein
VFAVRGWTRNSIRTILLNPAIAGLSSYHGDIVATGNWEPLVPEETWRAVRAILDDRARKPPRGVRTLLGGLALCPCSNITVGSHSHTGHQMYRCSLPTRDRTRPGPHVARIVCSRTDGASGRLMPPHRRTRRNR